MERKTNRFDNVLVQVDSESPGPSTNWGAARNAVRHAQLSSPWRQAPLTNKAQAQFKFGHRSFQTEQQPVVHHATTVDPIVINHQRAGQCAQVDPMEPVASVA
jgi:hypothetical protein